MSLIVLVASLMNVLPIPSIANKPMFDSAVFGHARAFIFEFVFETLGELDACHVDFTSFLFPLFEHGLLSLVKVVLLLSPGIGTWHDGIVVEKADSEGIHGDSY